MVSYLGEDIIKLHDNTCLNPCCSGRWSRTMVKADLGTALVEVLILVVVEDGLVLFLH